MRRVLSFFLLLVGLFGLLAAAQDVEAAFDPNECDMDNQRMEMWDETYRKLDFLTSMELPDFLVEIKTMYLAEAEAFLERETEYEGSFRSVYKAVIEQHFNLLARYYYLQLQYGELCFGSRAPEERAEYCRERRQATTRLALQMLAECIWSSACGWTNTDTGNHPVAQKLAAMPVQPHFGEPTLLKDYLSHMQKHHAICNVDRKTYARALVDMRFSRLRSLIDVLATIHYNTRQNMLGSTRWDDEKSGALAAALVVCQFDALCHLMHHAMEGGLYMTDGMSFYIGTSHTDNRGIFHENQEAFLRRAFNVEASQNAETPAAAPAAESAPTPATEAAEAPVAASAPAAEGGTPLFWLILAPVGGVLCLLLGLFLGVRLQTRIIR